MLNPITRYLTIIENINAGKIYDFILKIDIKVSLFQADQNDFLSSVVAVRGESTSSWLDSVLTIKPEAD